MSYAPCGEYRRRTTTGAPTQEPGDLVFEGWLKQEQGEQCRPLRQAVQLYVFMSRVRPRASYRTEVVERRCVLAREVPVRPAAYERLLQLEPEGFGRGLSGLPQAAIAGCALERSAFDAALQLDRRAWNRRYQRLDSRSLDCAKGMKKAN